MNDRKSTIATEVFGRTEYNTFDTAAFAASRFHAATALAGESVMRVALKRIRAGHSDPDHLLRAVSKVAACDGLKVLPGSALLAAIRLLQKAIEEAHDVR